MNRELSNKENVLSLIIAAPIMVLMIVGCTPDPKKDAEFQNLMDNPTVDGERIVLFINQFPKKTGCGCSSRSTQDWIDQAISIGDQKGWVLVEQNSDMMVFKLKPESQAIAKKNGGKELMQALTEFVAEKDAEIVKLTSAKQESQAILSNIPDQSMTVHITSLVSDIDARLEMLNSLRDKARIFMNDVDNYAKVESIRQWLNKN